MKVTPVPWLLPHRLSSACPPKLEESGSARSSPNIRERKPRGLSLNGTDLSFLRRKTRKTRSYRNMDGTTAVHSMHTCMCVGKHTHTHTARVRRGGSGQVRTMPHHPCGLMP